MSAKVINFPSGKQTSVQAFQVAKAKQEGIKAAWLGTVNPFVPGGELWKAFNAGRKMAATSSPGLSSEFVWLNAFTFEGLLWSEVSSITDGLIG